jgi:hypothetical protein
MLLVLLILLALLLLLLQRKAWQPYYLPLLWRPVWGAY